MGGKTTAILLTTPPLLSTLAALITLILILTAGLNKSSAVQRNLYFFRADASSFRNNISTDATNGIAGTEENDLIPGTDIDEEILGGLKEAAVRDGLKDVYQIYLWGYCVGDVDDDVEKQEKGSVTITNCSDPKPAFTFDPIEVWGLENNVSGNFADTVNAAARKLLPEAVSEGLDIYAKVSTAIFIAYVVAVSTAGLTFLLGLVVLALTIFSSSSISPSPYSDTYPLYSSPSPSRPASSRFTSLATKLTVSTSIVSFFLTLGASLTATVLFNVLVGEVNDGLESYGITASVGQQMLIVMWLAVGFSGLGAVAWVITGCCCAKRRNTAFAEKGARRDTLLKDDGFGYQDEKKYGLVNKKIKGLFGRLKASKKPKSFDVKNVRFNMVNNNDGYDHYRGGVGDDLSSNQKSIDDDLVMNDGQNNDTYGMYDDRSYNGPYAGVGTDSGPGVDYASMIGAGPYGHASYEEPRTFETASMVADPYIIGGTGSTNDRRGSNEALLDPTTTVCDTSNTKDGDMDTALGVATATSFLPNLSSR